MTINRDPWDAVRAGNATNAEVVEYLIECAWEYHEEYLGPSNPLRRVANEALRRASLLIHKAGLRQ